MAAFWPVSNMFGIGNGHEGEVGHMAHDNTAEPVVNAAESADSFGTVDDVLNPADHYFDMGPPLAAEPRTFDGVPYEEDPAVAAADLETAANVASLAALAEPAWEPSAEELMVRGLLHTAPDEVQVAYLQDELARASERLPRRVTAAEAIDYAAMRLAHDALQAKYDAATEQLVVTVGLSKVLEMSYGERRHSTHYGKYVFPDGTVVPVARHVSIQVRDGKLTDDEFGNGAVTVCTRRIDAAGLPAFARDVAPIPAPGGVHENLMLTAGNLRPGQFERVAESYAHKLRVESHREAVAPWIASYMYLTPSNLATSQQDYGPHAISAGMRALLLGAPTNRQEAATLLAFAFQPASFEHLQEAIATPLPEVLDELQHYGATGRYVWLLEHAEAIELSVLDAERHAVRYDLGSATAKGNRLREQRIGRLEALADELRRMPSAANSSQSVVARPVQTAEAGGLFRWLRRRNNVE